MEADEEILYGGLTMAFYLVRAKLRPELAAELREQLESRSFTAFRPFGPSLQGSLAQARVDPASGDLLWEEECYCNPPLAEERALVLDHYFQSLQVERVALGQGWERIEQLPQWRERHAT